MRHPFQSIPVKMWPWAFLVLLTLTAVVMTAMNFAGAPLTTEPAPSGIVSYELAASGKKAGAILDSWDLHAKTAAGFQLGLDYLFMPLYASTLALACVMSASVFTKRGGGILATTGIALAWGMWLAAGFDAIENLGLVVMLFNGASSFWAQASFGAAVIKFTLLFVGIAYAAAAGAISLLTNFLPFRQRAGQPRR